MKIVVRISDKDVELTVTEARKIFDELSEVFGVQVQPVIVREYPYVPYVPYTPPSPWMPEPWVSPSPSGPFWTCGSTGNISSFDEFPYSMTRC